MFEFSLLDLSTAPLDVTVPDLSRTAEAACEVVRPTASARGITVLNRTQPVALGGLDEDACLQALANLLDSAIKYGKENGAVQISMERDGPFVRIAVEDDGPGIAVADRDKIFGLACEAPVPNARGPASDLPSFG